MGTLLYPPPMPGCPPGTRLLMQLVVRPGKTVAGPARAASVPAGRGGGLAALDRLRLAHRDAGRREPGRGGPPSVTPHPEEHSRP
jgi:hypothetical protein